MSITATSFVPTRCTHERTPLTSPLFPCRPWKEPAPRDGAAGAAKYQAEGLYYLDDDQDDSDWKSHSLKCAAVLCGAARLLCLLGAEKASPRHSARKLEPILTLLSLLAARFEKPKGRDMSYAPEVRVHGLPIVPLPYETNDVESGDRLCAAGAHHAHLFLLLRCRRTTT